MSWLEKVRRRCLGTIRHKPITGKALERRRTSLELEELEGRIIPAVDLKGIYTQATDVAQWGQSISVTSRIRNAGNTGAGAFQVQWYLSRDGIGSSDDVLLYQTGGGASYYHPRIAGARNGNYMTVNLQLPDVQPSGWSGSNFYTIMKTDSARQVRETNESNNFGQVGSGYDCDPITIMAQPAPATPSLTGPTATTTDTTPTITWTASTNADHYELWVDNLTTGQSKAIWQGNLSATSYTPSSPLAAGSYRAWVRAFNSAGQYSGWSANLDFTVAPRAEVDLKPDSVDAPDAATIGTTMSVSTKVVNNGGGSSGSFNVRYVLSTDTTIDAGDLMLHEVTCSSLGGDGGGGAGASYATSVLGFSSQYSGGSWSAAQATGAPDTDVYGDLATAWAPSPANGTLEYLTLGFDTPVAADGVTIRETLGNGFVYQVDALDTSDVLHTVWTGVDSSQPGSAVDFSVSWPMTGYAVKGVKIYVDTNHSAGWEEIDAVWLHSAGGDASKQWDEPIALPSNLPAGTYYTGVIVDPDGTIAETDESNNALADGDPITLTSAAVPATPSLTGPSGATGDTTPTITWTASTNADHYELWVDNLTTGQSKAVWQGNVTAASFTPSSPLTAGTYRAWVRAFNSAGQASDWSYALDFTVATLVQIDLHPYSVDVPNSALVGSTFDAWTGIENLGTSPSGDFTVSYYLNSDAAGTAADILLKTVTRSSIAGNAYQTWYESVTLPTDLAAANYHLRIVADPANAIAETSETNNTFTDGDWIAIATSRPAKPSLVGPSGSTTDTTPTISWTAVSGASRYDLWVDNLTTGQNQVLRRTDLAGTSFTPSHPLAAGTYRAWVRAVSAAGQSSDWSASLDFTVTPSTTNDWTIMVYATASNLEFWSAWKVNELERLAAEVPDTVHFVLLWDQTDSSVQVPEGAGMRAGQEYPTGNGSQPAWGDTGLAVIEPDRNNDPDWDLTKNPMVTTFQRIGEKSTGDPDTLKLLIDYAIQNAPATHYALLMQDHGGYFVSNEDMDGSGLPFPQPWTDHLTVDEVAGALKDETTAHPGLHLDIMAYDTCLMGGVEVAYALRNYAAYFLASEEISTTGTWNYYDDFHSLVSNPGQVTGRQLADNIATQIGQTLTRNFSSSTSNWGTTISAIRTADLDTLATDLKAFTTAVANNATASDWQILRQARLNADSFEMFGGASQVSICRDLGNFMTYLASQTSLTGAVRTAAANVAAALKNAVLGYTSLERTATGLSIYLQPPGNDPDYWYGDRTAGFQQATGWLDFLRSFGANG